MSGTESANALTLAGTPRFDGDGLIPAICQDAIDGSVLMLAWMNADALARTLAVDPAVLLMDEPFSALDAQTKMVLQQDLGRTLAETGKTALFVTHDLVEAIALSDRVLVMSQRPGRIIEVIPIDIPDRGNPMERRKSAKLGPYVATLMDLLHIGETIG